MKGWPAEAAAKIVLEIILHGSLGMRLRFRLALSLNAMRWAGLWRFDAGGFGRLFWGDGQALWVLRKVGKYPSSKINHETWQMTLGRLTSLLRDRLQLNSRGSDVTVTLTKIIKSRCTANSDAWIIRAKNDTTAFSPRRYAHRTTSAIHKIPNLIYCY